MLIDIILLFCVHIITLWLFSLSLCLCLILFAVNVILKERKSKDSITLAWQGPDRPNGVIVEYEVIYYEKVRLLFICFPFFFSPLLLPSEQAELSSSHTDCTHASLTSIKSCNDCSCPGSPGMCN